MEETELTGTTLRVYLYILRSRKEYVGVREIMRALNMRTPSHAYYHLDKLVRKGLLTKKYGEYHLVKSVKIDLLRDYIILGGSIVPKFAFYTTFFLTILVYSLLAPRPYELYWYITTSSSLIASIYGIIESIRSWRRIKA